MENRFSWNGLRDLWDSGNGGTTLEFLSPFQSACNEGDLGLIPGLGRSPGEGNGNPLHHPCLENLMDREA